MLSRGGAGEASVWRRARLPRGSTEATLELRQCCVGWAWEALWERCFSVLRRSWTIVFFFTTIFTLSSTPLYWPSTLNPKP